jgi:LacI family transcriptional regulator
VSLDDVEGARLAMDHLLDLGHRRIALVNGPSRVSWCAARREGSVTAVRARGLDPAQLIVDVVVDDLTVAEGRAAVGPLLDRGGLTAVMCVNDMLALGVLLAVRERGLDVPGDIALVGYDDADFAPALDPPLTTVHQPSYEMGVAAAKLLLGPRQPGAHIEFEPRLIVRRSSTGLTVTI